MTLLHSSGEQSQIHIICHEAGHGSTTTMRTHLQNHHKNVALEEQEEQMERHQKMIGFVVAIRSCDSKQQGQITALVTSMITDDMLPLSVVEGEGFKRLMELGKLNTPCLHAKPSLAMWRKSTGAGTALKEKLMKRSALYSRRITVRGKLNKINGTYLSHTFPQMRIRFCVGNAMSIISNILPSTPYNT